ncbi:MAG TPA: hypothetical protein VEZ90_03900 [Blastocatellia bacterium]|nr:hypothetical protein [Blastocatellia bacterium]
MEDTILIAHGSSFKRIPESEWKSELADLPARMKRRLAFMTADHHRVRSYVVQQLPKSATAITPRQISRALSLPVPSVNSILEDLERNLFFLVRDGEGRVAWAFPVTVEPTPHRLKFSTGEETYAA